MMDFGRTAALRHLLNITSLIAAITLVACDETKTFDDTGGLCILGESIDDASSDTSETSELVSFAADTEQRVFVRLGGISDGCFRDLKARCDVQQNGSDLLVNAHASYVDTGKRQQLCTAEYTYIDAKCQTPKLPAGRYHVHYGDHAAVSLIIPSESPPIVVGSLHSCGH